MTPTKQIGDKVADEQEIPEGDFEHPTVPKFRNFDLAARYDPISFSGDYEDMAQVTAALSAAPAALIGLTNELNIAERRARRAESKHQRFWRRSFLNSEGKTEAVRRARADLAAERYEDDFIFHDQLKLELVRSIRTMRDEISALESIANNVRAQTRL